MSEVDRRSPSERALDDLGQLRERIQILRGRPKTVPWSWILLEPDVFSCRRRGFLGVVLIDGRIRRPLFNRESRLFRLEPGEHLVEVYLCPGIRSRVREGAAVATRQFTLGAGASARLRFGRRAAWRRYDAFQRREACLFIVLTVLVAIGAWLAFPLFRETIAGITLAANLGGLWLSLMYLPVQSRVASLDFICFFWLFIGTRLLSARYRHRFQQFKEQLGEPYFLALPREDRWLNIRTDMGWTDA